MQDFIYENDQTVIYAPGGVGKSLIAQDFAMALGANFDQLWGGAFQIPKARVALFAQSENSRAAVHQRTVKKCTGNPDYIQGLQNVIYASSYGNLQVSGHVSDQAFRQRFVSFAKSAEDENGFKIGLLVFDPLISFHDAEENDNSRMRTTLDQILTIANEIQATPIVIHHANKNQGLRGGFSYCRLG